MHVDRRAVQKDVLISAFALGNVTEPLQRSLRDDVAIANRRCSLKFDLSSEQRNPHRGERQFVQKPSIVASLLKYPSALR
jgi:hypothetical protein